MFTQGGRDQTQSLARSCCLWRWGRWQPPKIGAAVFTGMQIRLDRTVGSLSLSPPPRLVIVLSAPLVTIGRSASKQTKMPSCWKHRGERILATLWPIYCPLASVAFKVLLDGRPPPCRDVQVGAFEVVPPGHHTSCPRRLTCPLYWNSRHLIYLFLGSPACSSVCRLGGFHFVGKEGRKNRF